MIVKGCVERLARCEERQRVDAESPHFHGQLQGSLPVSMTRPLRAEAASLPGSTHSMPESTAPFAVLQWIQQPSS